MSDEPKEAPGETPETPIEQPAGETPKVDRDPSDRPGADGQPFDPERAKATIEKLRGFEKEAEKLRKENEALRKKEQARAEAEMTELEKEKARAEKAEAELRKLERQAMQREIAEKVGLPASLALRLQGESAEEIEADAKALLETLPKAEKKTTALSATNPGVNAGTHETDAQKRERLFGNQHNPFSDAEVLSKGGGVYFTDKD